MTSETWTPAFPGQRPPFPQGHEITMTSGAQSPRKFGPLAEQIEQQARTSEAWPAYLRDPTYAPAVAAWARAEAIVALLSGYLAERDLDEALTDVSREESTETHGKTSSKRITTGRRTTAALDRLLKAESAAANHRSRLGLDPLSRVRLGKDIAITAVQAGLAELQANGAQLVASARAAGALTDSTPDPADDRSDQLSGRHDANEATDD